MTHVGPASSSGFPPRVLVLGLFDETRRCPPGGGDAFGEFGGKGARYWDNVRSWPTVEPAIDFVATTPLAFALLIETASASS